MKGGARVFALIPTFNRKDVTLAAIATLKAQTRPPDRIIVSDGGSTDGTREAVAAAYPDVTVLRTPGEAWWAGSMAFGFDHILAAGVDDEDRVLMMNDDIVLPEGYVETLLAVSLAENAAVCGVTVDAARPEAVLDAGEYIEWRRYFYRVATDWPRGGLRDDVDFLPGRASVVSVRMVRKAGNVDARTFPHYIADYDFFARVRAAGFRLCVTGDTWVGCMTEKTGLVGQPSTFREALKLMTSRRSAQAFPHHWRFIWRHAPGFRLKLRLTALSALYGAKKLVLSARGRRVDA
jgi:GT2 family glycosyltransferase